MQPPEVEYPLIRTIGEVMCDLICGNNSDFHYRVTHRVRPISKYDSNHAECSNYLQSFAPLLTNESEFSRKDPSSL